MAWPKEVPILTADDIHKGSSFSVDGKRCCLLGWRFRVFADTTDSPQYKKVYTTLDMVCGGGIASFNDSRKNSKAKVARAWNVAMALLGYTEGNPEAEA